MNQQKKKMIRKHKREVMGIPGSLVSLRPGTLHTGARGKGLQEAGRKTDWEVIWLSHHVE